MEAIEGKAGFEALFEAALEVDEDALEDQLRAGEAVIGDEEVRLLLRENRIGLFKGETKRVSHRGKGDPSLIYYDAPFVCVIHAHPECRFRWARLRVDLRVTPDALIRDMVPEEVAGDHPVELKATYKGGVTFDTTSKVLGSELSAEHSRSRTVYFPRIVASGSGSGLGYWDFLAEGDAYLHANRELRLLFSAPPEQPVGARLSLRAKVKLKGVGGLIPLLMRRGEINETYRLA